MRDGVKIKSIEYLRIFALLSVIVIHFNAQGFFRDLPILGFSLDTLGRFAVPLFFFISGYLTKDTHLNHPKLYLVHSFNRLLIPYLIWFLLFNWHYLSQDVDFGSAKSLQKLAYHIFLKGGAGYHLWFLPALFLGSNLAVLSQRLPFHVSTTISLTLYLVGISISHFTDLPNWVSRSGIFFTPVFFHLGVVSKDIRVTDFLRKHCYWLLSAGIALHFLESCFFAKNIQFSLNLSIGLLLYTPGIFGIFLRHLEIDSPLIFLGKHVFGAYLIHVSVIYGLQWGNIRFSADPFTAILLTLCSSLTISAILSRIPHLRRLVT